MEVNKRVAQYITQNGLDIAVIADKSELQEAEIRDMLDGKRAMDAVDLRNLCLAMNISPEYFINSFAEESNAKKGSYDHE